MNPDVVMQQLVTCFFAPVFTLALFLVFWGFDVYVYNAMKIDYNSALNLVATEKTVARPVHFVTVGLALATGVVVSEHLWVQITGSMDIGGIFSFLFSVMVLLLALPLGIRFKRNIDAFRGVFFQVLWPTQPVEFCHVFVADALTSLSSSLRDVARGGLLLFDLYLSARIFGSPEERPLEVAEAFATPSADASLDATIPEPIAVIPLHQTVLGVAFVELVACSPYLLRMQQCILSRRHSTSASHRFAQFLNTFKYATAIPIFAVGITSAVMKSQGREDLIITLAWILLVARSVNSTYSLVWDLVMDWGLWNPTRRGAARYERKGRSHRPRLIPGFFPSIVYVLAAILDVLARFAWITVLIPSLGAMQSRSKMEEATEEPAPADGGVEVEVGPAGVEILFGWSLFFHVVEVARRSMWNVVRVEWEVLQREAKQENALRVAGAGDEESLRSPLSDLVRIDTPNMVMRLPGLADKSG